MILYVFVGSTILMEFLYFLKIDVLKILVLLGTFALAMSFAGNDLVNFIGRSRRASSLSGILPPTAQTPPRSSCHP